ncbi:GNAT family N-acetyltransferase [Cellulomonas hominis]
MVLADVPWSDPRAVRLRAAQQAELRARYGDEGTPEPPPAEVAVTVLATVGDEPVACGSLRDQRALLGAGIAEVKRVYVAPGHRGGGLARTVMTALESRAVAGGWHRLVLETGTQQPEAVGLYLSLGYLSIDNYGEWVGVVDSRCFAKDVPTGAPRAEQEPSDRRAPSVASDRPGVASAPEVEIVVLDGAPGRAEELFAVQVRHGGEAVVGASVRRLAPGAPDGAGEVVRLVVPLDAGGADGAPAVLHTLEQEAVRRGVTSLVLATSVRRPEVVELCRTSGYRVVLPFPPHAADPHALCFGKTLALAPTAEAAH